jgi:hypothetical protein
MGWDGMEWNVKQSGQRRDVGLELELDSLAAVVCAAHAFFRGGLFCSSKFFSTARSVEWSRGGLALRPCRHRSIGAVAAALPCSLLAFPPQIIAGPWLSN